MKKARIWIIIGIIAVLITLITLEQIFLNNTINYLNEQTYSLESEITENENINSEYLINKINDFHVNWHKKETILCLICNHKDIENVGEQIEKLKVVIKQNDKEQAEVEIELLTLYVKTFEQLVSVTIENFF